MPLTTIYTDNTSTPVIAGDYGLKIAKAGFDVLTASDSDLLFNSSWPSLQIVAVITDTTGSPFAHGLTFPPLVMATGPVPRPVDSTYIYGGTGTVVVYNLDISVDVDYSYTTKTSSSNTYDPDYGIKMVKDGESIDSTDLRDYLVHSRCGTPLVLAVKNTSTSTYTVPTAPADYKGIQYTQKLGYPVFVFGYVKAGVANFGSITSPIGTWHVSPLAGQSYPVTATNGTISQLFITPPTTTDASLVILRTPMFATTNTVNVVF